MPTQKHFPFIINDLRAFTGKVRKKLIKPEGKLIIRTQLYKTPDSICKWWYTGDITHINFFSKKAIKHVASKIGLKLVSVCNEDIFIFA